MSLTDQQWCPTSVQVTVLQARGLRIKGKSGTNDAYAVMQVGKEKFQTSVVEKSVAPVWKEEAAFDLPPLHQGGGGGRGGTELHVHVLHRALVGPDKLLGQAVINLLQLSEDKTRNKTEWFKLLDKTGKADKDRGEVLVDIQFMKNNMTASMFDLSAAGKSKSRMGKFKDKVRGKKKESDAASNLVPSFTQVLTDSEEEGNGDAEVSVGKDEKKKKHKMKSLFSPKSNLQKNMSQSMSVLPAKNSTLSGSQSSGLNMDSSEGKKKFKFMIHKRSGSSGSKDSSPGQQKQGTVEQSNLCINGSHVYCEEPQPRNSRIGSNFSLASSGHGSMEDVPESSPPSVDSLRAARQYSPWTEEEEEEVDNLKEDVGELRREEEMRMEEEERRRKEEEEERVRRQEEMERFAEEKRRQEEQQRRTEEEKVKKEEEERIRREEEEERAQEERRRQEEEERVRREEEERERLAEEKRRLEEQERRRIEEEERRQREEEERAQEERRQEEERRIRRKEEEERERLEKEKRRLEEQERRRIEEEERRQRVEEERAQAERRRQEEEEKVRREEEERERLKEEKRRLEEQERRRSEEEAERRRQEEEERVRKIEEEERKRLKVIKRRLEEEKRRIEEENVRKEEEERAEEERRRREEEELKLAEEKRRLEEEERRIEEEKVRKEEDERIRREERLRREEEEREERRRLEEQERRRREEEERIKKEEERRQEEEEKARREKEEFERLVEEKRKQEEEERKRIEEEEKIRREEEERIRVEEERRRKEEEEERAKRQEEEREKLAEEKRVLEEQERRRIEEEEKRQREEEERVRKEEERRQEEEERVRKEKEEYERLVEEKVRQEEQERRRIEEEEKIKKEDEERMRRVEKAERERREEEARKLEKEKLTREAEEQKKKENKTKHKAAVKKPKVAAEVTSTNPFDENFSNPFEEMPDSPAGPDSSTAKVSSVQPRIQFPAASERSKPVSTEEKDPIGTQREKRPAPQPPGGNQAERQSQREQDGSARHLAQVNKQSKDKDVKTVSVQPQRSVQMITPLNRSPTDAKNTQSLMQSSTTTGTSNAAKNGKRPAPSRPRSVVEGPSSEHKTAPSSDGNMSHKSISEAKQVPIVYGLNPFEDDEDENAAQDDATTSGNTGSVQWPPVTSQAADKDAASQAKIKSSKTRAPPVPAQKAATSSTSINQSTEGDHVTDGTGVTGPDNSSCDPETVNPVRVQEAPLQESQPAMVQSAGEEAGGRKEGPPVTSRRLQPVKPLNPLEQQSVSVIQGEKDKKSTGILCEDQEKIKVNDTGLKGPYSQLTQEELISLVLKQENQLSERDKKISELEQYIDNLLLRVMEEKPSILMFLNSQKKAT